MGLEVRDLGAGGERIHQQIAEMVGVLHRDPHQEVELAGDVEDAGRRRQLESGWGHGDLTTGHERFEHEQQERGQDVHHRSHAQTTGGRTRVSPPSLALPPHDASSP
jgi:hypothetical protein